MRPTIDPSSTEAPRSAPSLSRLSAPIMRHALKHHGGTLAGRGQLFGKGVQSWQRSPRDKSRIFHRKSPIFSLSQGPRKSRKIRTFPRKNLRLCSFSDWLHLHFLPLPRLRVRRLIWGTMDATMSFWGEDFLPMPAKSASFSLSSWASFWPKLASIPTVPIQP
jgi:hypothetical protein